MIIFKPVLLGMMFLSELIVLYAFGLWGYHQTNGFTKYVLCFTVPLIIAMIWGLFLSPKAAYLLPPFWRTVLQLLIFAVGARALYVTGLCLSAWIFIIISSIGLLLIRFFEF
ncbi:YrdB family protein [Fictibacillus fluitans]|uniref:YrdB family protein n=1 Tax=Fictibacillus fluitans TaxID=3058422 RepID=A0ABT8I267_9BACL|nr:YrdB family protein [Fictibacillus sp. NE201]MDN4526805.1 YrdB family protein [Fictibacillus sp. NE201]